MKRLFFLTVAISLFIGACGTSAAPTVPQAAAPTQAQIYPSPISAADLNATAAAMAQQTIAAMPTQTPLPTATPLPPTETPSETPSPAFTATEAFTPTETQNPILLTLTATLGAGTPGALPQATSALPTGTPGGTTPTETPYPRVYGTMPPDLPAGKILIFNKAKSEATISLHCTTKEGYVTYIEYPVEGAIKVKAPAGNYSYVVWVGGHAYRGSFKLLAGEDASVVIYRDHVEAKGSRAH